MTITIETPTDQSGVNIPTSNPPYFGASGTNDTGDDVSGYLLDTNTNDAFGCVGETLGYDSGTQLWDWTLQFQTDRTIALNDQVCVNVYDAETGGDNDYVTVHQTAGVAAGAATAAAVPKAGAAAPAAPASVIPTVAVVSPPLAAGTTVVDISVTVTLQPAGTKGYVFLHLLKLGGAHTVLHHHLPASTQLIRTVVFRQIDAGNWDRIHAVAAIRRHGGSKPAVAKIM